MLSEGQEAEVLIGYDVDEPHRAIGKTREGPFRYRYPLIGWGWGRAECVAYLKAAGLPVGHKSACWYCPSSSSGDLLRLDTLHPHLLDSAVALEDRGEENTHENRGLGGRGRWWRPIVEGIRGQGELFTLGPDSFAEFDRGLPNMPCGCYDSRGSHETA